MAKMFIGLGVMTASLAALALAGCQTSGPPRPRQLVISQQCADLDFPIYFQRLSAKLDVPAEQVIADAGRASKGCNVASVSVIGLAGGKDPRHALLDLSSRRASMVAKALSTAGFPEPKFEVSAQANGDGPGDAGHEPMRRRAEVIVKFAH